MGHVMELNHITKDYGSQKGVFGLTFYVDNGEQMILLPENQSQCLNF
ncbi:hypothetical protein [Velocimicrobium porci]|nr:hypothetical protein [Velocimicrobium porci]